MSGTPLRVLLALAAVLALGGCGIGDDDPTVPEQNATALLERLQAVEDNVSAANCAAAVQQAEDFATEVNALPADVDDELKQGLQEGAARLVELARDEADNGTECGIDSGTSDAGGVLETTEAPPTDASTTPSEADAETQEPEEETDNPPASEGPAEEELVPPGSDESGGEDGGGDSGTLDDTGGIGQGDG